MFRDDMLQKFWPASAAVVDEIIMKSLNKACDPDLVPAWRLKKDLDQLLQLIRNIINKSFTESVIASCLKRTTIRPKLKKGEIWQTIGLKRTFPLFLNEERK